MEVTPSSVVPEGKGRGRRSELATELGLKTDPVREEKELKRLMERDEQKWERRYGEEMGGNLDQSSSKIRVVQKSEALKWPGARDAGRQGQQVVTHLGKDQQKIAGKEQGSASSGGEKIRTDPRPLPRKKQPVAAQQERPVVTQLGSENRSAARRQERRREPPSAKKVEMHRQPVQQQREPIAGRERMETQWRKKESPELKQSEKVLLFSPHAAGSDDFSEIG